MELIGKIFGHIAAFVVIYFVITTLARAEPERSGFAEAICAMVVNQARINESVIVRLPLHLRHGKIYWRLKNNQRMLRKQLKATCGVDLSTWPY